MKKEKFQITGMSCSACSAKIEKEVGKMPGVGSAAVNLLRGTMEVQLKEDTLRAEDVSAKVKSLGYGALQEGSKAPEVQDEDMKKRMLWSFALLLPLMYVSMGSMVGLPLPFFLNGMENAISFGLIQLLITVPIVFLNRKYFIKGFSLLLRGSPNMDSLIAVGSGAALAYGVFALFRMSYAMGIGDMDTVHHYHMQLYFESAAMILTLITFGKYLEARSKGKTGAAIERLLDMSPKTALVQREGEELEIPSEELIKGDRVVIRPGARIPADGTVISGHSAIDESAITGESMPAEKEAGDKVRAATVNTWGSFIFTADKVGQDTTFAEIIRLVEEAGAQKAPMAKLADKISGIFVPVVMAIALLTAVIWLLVGAGVEFALSMGIAVLVISCPCALGLATPVAVMVGTGKGAEMGVLIKSGEAFETAGKINTVVFDKTGTLTTGKHRVIKCIEFDSRLKSIALSLESLSEHPLAKAVLEFCKGEKQLAPTDFAAVAGLGIQGRIDGELYFAGSERFIKEKTGLSAPAAQKQGTPLIFAAENKLLGAMYTADALKPDSKAAVKALKGMGIDTVMLTGDSQSIAEQIGSQAGVDKIIAQVLPGEKEAKIRELMDKGRVVAMVGDGINDAPALTAASVGFAMGEGTDVAMESADIVLTGKSLMSVPNAVRLSKNVSRNIRQNLFWAFFYNAVGIPVAAGLFFAAWGLRLDPMLGALAMSLSSLCVVSNALRLRYFKPVVLTDQGRTDNIEQKQIKEEVKMMKVKIEGMMCAHCQANVKRVLTPLDPQVQVNLEEKCAYISNTADREKIKSLIEEAGYQFVGIE